MALITNNSPVLIPLLFLASAMLVPLIAWKRNSLAWPATMLVSLTSVVIAAFNVVRIMEVGKPIHYRLGDWAPPVGISMYWITCRLS